MGSQRITDRAWFARHPVEVAWELIGCMVSVCRDGTLTTGRIVETEAYAGPLDPASHASRLANAREVMAGPPGRVYTYRSYGIHTMLNVVAHEDCEVGAVLIRALEPIEGIEAMRERRYGAPDTRLASGPGTLAQAMGIRLDDLGTDLTRSDELALWHGEPCNAIHAGPRIGITRAVHAPFRFFESGSPHVSRHRRGDPVTRQELPSIIPPAGTPIE